MRASTLLRMELSTTDSGWVTCAMASVSSPGLMERATRVSGRITRLMDVACFTMSMGTSSMANGMKTKPTASGPTSM